MATGLATCFFYHMTLNNNKYENKKQKNLGFGTFFAKNSILGVKTGWKK